MSTLSDRTRQDATIEVVVDALTRGDTDAYLSVCADDVLLDVVVPHWRFQVEGRAAAREALAGEFLPERQVHERHVTRTEDGVLVELAATARSDGHEVTWWDIHQFRLRDDKVVEHISYCSGMLDAEALRRQQAEAPMVRPR